MIELQPPHYLPSLGSIQAPLPFKHACEYRLTWLKVYSGCPHSTQPHPKKGHNKTEWNLFTQKHWSLLIYYDGVMYSSLSPCQKPHKHQTPSLLLLLIRLCSSCVWAGPVFRWSSGFGLPAIARQEVIFKIGSFETSWTQDCELIKNN